MESEKEENKVTTLDKWFNDMRKEANASYNKATGWMRLKFPSIPPLETRTSMKQLGFRYKPMSKTWSAKWTFEREKFAKSIAGTIGIVDIKPNWAKKAAGAMVMSEKHKQESEQQYSRFRKELSTIPMGQPILVGHHSEKSHRAHLKRLDNMMKKTFEERQKAKHYEEKAKRFEVKAKGESPGVIYRRIQRLEAEQRKMKSQLLGDVIFYQGKYYRRKGSEPSAERKQEINKWIEHYESRLTVEREKYKTSGGIFAERVKLKAGDIVRTAFGPATIVKINPKTITVQRPFGKLKLDKSEIRGKVI